MELKEKNDFPYWDVLNDLFLHRLSLKDFTSKLNEMNIAVIGPDQAASMEMRDDFSRFFPEIKDGVVVGGKFQ